MRVKDSHGKIHHPKNSVNETLLREECLRQARLLTGHHPDTGVKMSVEEIRQWNAGIESAND